MIDRADVNALRAALILLGGMGSMAALAGFLMIGHLRGKIDLWEIFRDYRTKRTAWRVVAAAFAFIGSTTAMFISAVHGGDAFVWIYSIYITAWVARDLLGILAGAKAQGISKARGFTPQEPDDEPEPPKATVSATVTLPTPPAPAQAAPSRPPAPPRKAAARPRKSAAKSKSRRRNA